MTYEKLIAEFTDHATHYAETGKDESYAQGVYWARNKLEQHRDELELPPLRFKLIDHGRYNPVNPVRLEVVSEIVGLILPHDVYESDEAAIQFAERIAQSLGLRAEIIDAARESDHDRHERG